MGRPNILVIMTDEERYPPPYEPESAGVPAHAADRPGIDPVTAASSSTATTPVRRPACPSRATLFTGQYPSLHGVTQTDGVAKQNTDPAMGWLDPNAVPTLGDWFRAGGYQTHYRGKWHVSHADLVIPGTHEGLMASDDDGRADPRRRSRPTARPTASTRSASPGGSAASPTARPSPTAAPSATACSPSRWSTCSTSWPRPGARARGWRWPRS